MSEVLIRPEVDAVLRTQGITTEVHLGLLDCDELKPMLEHALEGAKVDLLKSADDGARAARSAAHYVLLATGRHVMQLIQLLGTDVATIVAIIAVGSEGPTAATLRSMGAMAVVPEPTQDNLVPLIKRGIEYRALRALELAHRCEARRLARREMDLLGHPPETMTDDINTYQPPPLPVGPISTYNLEEASEAFERAYIDRVQHLCASAREAAQYLDVSAATLARRLRKEGTGSLNGA
ncbi:MAG: hypothetical protein IT384_18580 [Deltaproteobacteria bacterium]|nr:hypothetical protein [Deltaproteobacteria bacterium]